MDTESARESGLNPEKLPTGAFVGIAMLSDVRPFTREDAKALKRRRAGGGWRPDQFAWVLRKTFRLPHPIKAKGQLRLFGVSASVTKLVEPYVRKLQALSRKPKSRRIPGKRSNAAHANLRLGKRHDGRK